MTTIEKLQLSGIRSYDPATPVVIPFMKPLTMFVGSNGSGKTTIIEALRFVCTGQNPPDSLKGKSFVHDPLFTGDCLVKSQIKITLRTVENRPVKIIRSFQLSQRAKVRRYQQIDATVCSVDDQGERITATHKCVEVDGIASQIMKVSKAILINVIFCHQSDSLWPMGESKALKLKFDEIFSSTRYTKALEKMKTTRKNLRVKISFLEKDLLLIKNNLQNYRKSTLEVENLSEQILILEKTAKNLQIDIEKDENILKKYEEKRNDLQKKQTEINNLNFQLKTLSSNKEELSMNIKLPSEDTEEELIKLKKESESKLSILEKQIDDRQGNILRLEETFNKLKKEQESNIENIGKMQAESDRNSRERVRMEKLTEEIAKSHNVTVSAGTDIEQAFELIQSLRNLINDKKTNLKKQTDKISMVEESNRQKLSLVGRKTATISQIRKQIKTEKENTIVKISNLRKQITVLEERINSNNRVKEEIESNKNELQIVERKISEGNYERRIEENDKNKKDLKEKLRFCDIDLDLAITQINSKERIKQKEKAVENMKKLFLEKIELIKNTFGKIYKGDFSDEDFPQIFKTYIEDKSKQHDEDEIQFKDRFISAKSAFDSCKGKLTVTKRDSKEIQRLIDGKKEKIPKNVKIEEIDKMLKEAQESLVSLQSKIVFEKGAIFIYKKISEKISEENKCPICEKKLFKKDLSLVVSRLEEKISSFENNEKSKKFQTSAEKIKKKVLKLRGLMPFKNDLKNLDKTLGEKKESAKDLEKVVRDREDLVKKMNSENLELVKEGKQISNALENAKELWNLSIELSKSETELKKEKLNMENMYQNQIDYNDLKKDRNLILEKIDKNEAEISKLRKEKEILLSKRHEHTVEISRLRAVEGELSSTRKEINKTENEVGLETHSLEEFNKKLKETEEKLRANEFEYKKLEKSMKENSIKFNLFRKSTEEQVQSLSQSRDKLCDLAEGIQRFDSLEAKRAEIFDLFRKQKSETSAVENELRRTTLEAKEDAEKSKDILSVLSNISMVLELRKKEKEFEKILEKRELLRKELLETSNGEDIEELLNNKREQLDGLKKMLFETTGRKSAFKDQALKNKKAITSNRAYDNIEEKFKETSSELETNMVVNKDLEIYSKALDQALIEFHSIKMTEINQILKKYWKLVYKGEDIDYIEIVSDSKDLATATQTNRNYNYFVVMVCGRVRLEMRGRCSAGQKVLASLLIRLALAESFCGNCNILALDEPAANLDKDNAKAFAVALRELVRTKSRNSDFQLLLITHSEAFVEMLNAKEFAGEFYKVYKNEDNYSKVRRVRL